MAKISAIDITSLLFQEGSAPSTPASTKWRLYFKTDGLYFKDDAGSEVGPLAAAGGAPTFVGARVYHSTTQSLANNTSMALAFDSERFDSNAFHDTSTDNTRLTVPSGKGGKYLIGGHWSITTTDTDGFRSIGIRLNGSVNIGNQEIAVGTAVPNKMTIVSLYDMAVGDYAELMAFQNSGSSLTISADASRSPEFWMTLIGS